jgi:dipeptidyl aminopeptidase/acylaminoacyl peptidase
VTWFDELTEYVALPRVTGLCLSPDGRWLAAVVQSPWPEPKKYGTSIWRILTGQEPSGVPEGGTPEHRQEPAVRLTRSAEGESAPAFLPDGSLLFASKRPEPWSSKSGDDDAKPALWLLPAGGGEARRVAAPPGGVSSVVTARAAGRYLIAAPTFAGTSGFEQDAERRKARADADVSGILHEAGFVRYWDHDLGPDCPRLLTAEPAAEASEGAGEPEPRDLTPDSGRALDEQAFCLSPDGSLAVTGWSVPEAAGGTRTELAVIDVATSGRRTLVGASGVDYSDPAISADGRYVAAIRSEHDGYQRPGDVTLVCVALNDRAEAAERDLLPGFDRRPLSAAWAADSETIYFTADDNGRCPVFAVRVGTGEVARVTADDAAYESLCPAPDGQALYALRSSVSEPPVPVSIPLAANEPWYAAGGPVKLPAPTRTLEVPGRVEEVSAVADDATTIRGWLVLPDGAAEGSPVPLLLWVHGGPVMSWNAWSWRWNPWLMAARGYAVLLPDPALSTGYGADFIARGHGTWGDKPYSDLMAITDAVVARPDIDASRSAMLGGSFGGYMANWIAGHTDRFRAIVSHAGVWALDQMFATTDFPPYWWRMFGRPDAQPERYAAWSPHHFVADIRTPMLIIHGDRDYRVPVGEALRLYAELSGSGKPARFLYFPDENHWILKPGDVKVWYETIFAFLAEHVLGEDWHRPELL